MTEQEIHEVKPGQELDVGLGDSIEVNWIEHRNFNSFSSLHISKCGPWPGQK